MLPGKEMSESTVYELVRNHSLDELRNARASQPTNDWGNFENPKGVEKLNKAIQIKADERGELPSL